MTDVLTLDQVASELQISLTTVRRLVATKELSAFRAGRRQWRVRRNALNRYMDGQREVQGDVPQWIQREKGWDTYR
jgi:excisionase family DNA binding protein